MRFGNNCTPTNGTIYGKDSKYASIMLDAFRYVHTYYAQNYASIISQVLHFKGMPACFISVFDFEGLEEEYGKIGVLSTAQICRYDMLRLFVL